MEIKDIMEFIDFQDKYLIEKFGKNYSLKEKVFARNVKLSEEVGELSSEVLTFFKDQRKEKLEESTQNNLELEFADVIITTMLLAKSMDVDVFKALDIKIEKIRKRNSLNS